MLSAGFWLLVVNSGLAAMVLVPAVLVGVAVARDIAARRAGRRWAFVDVPGIGPLPVLSDGDRTGASCRRA